MALKNVPINDPPINKSGFFKETWISWFRSIRLNFSSIESRLDTVETGWSGTFTNADGDTVTVSNGRITDVS